MSVNYFRKMITCILRKLFFVFFLDISIRTNSSYQGFCVRYLFCNAIGAKLGLRNVGKIGFIMYVQSYLNIYQKLLTFPIYISHTKI